MPSIQEEQNDVANNRPSAEAANTVEHATDVETAPAVVANNQRCPTPPPPENLSPTHQSFTVSLHMINM